MKTGEVVASMPVLDDLPEGYQVAVENAAIVYDDGEARSTRSSATGLVPVMRG